MVKLYHQNLINTYQKHKNIFNSNYVLSNYNKDSSALYKIIKENIPPRYPNVAVNKWLKISETLSGYDNLICLLYSNCFTKIIKKEKVYEE